MSWVKNLIPLDRPEYATQPEALLTDLLWRSPGSSLSAGAPLNALAAISTPEGMALERLVAQKLQTSKGPVETYPHAVAADISDLIVRDGGEPSPMAAYLKSMLAPQARKARSAAFVPVQPALSSLQTLHGLVNKAAPPSLANIIESVGWLGGSPGKGAVARMLLITYSGSPSRAAGFTGFTDALAERASRHAWNTLFAHEQDPTRRLPWPGFSPGTVSVGSTELAIYKRTPFSWFWDHWQTLCSQEWANALPARRFVDWALCLLRTGLAFAYVWEARFFLALHAAIRERTSAQRFQELRSFLEEGRVLATVESADVPARERYAWTALGTVIATGYTARQAIHDYLTEHDAPELPVGAGDLPARLEAWVRSLPDSTAYQALARLPQASRNTAKNQQEFVRYLLLPRSADDDTADQTDFYYLMRSHPGGSWFEPGPEWLVVMTGLVARTPGGKCTLGGLVHDLSRLGLRVDRSVLIDMLEGAGLSSDSPDADDAVVVHSGF